MGGWPAAVVTRAKMAAVISKICFLIRFMTVVIYKQIYKNPDNELYAEPHFKVINILLITDVS
jgi:hypothetical protein